MHENRPTSVIQSRVDTRTLATLVQYYASQGRPKYTQSRLVRTALNDFANMLIRHRLAGSFDTLASAIDYLASHGLKHLSDSKRAREIIAAELEREAVLGLDKAFVDQPTLDKARQRLEEKVSDA